MAYHANIEPGTRFPQFYREETSVVRPHCTTTLWQLTFWRRIGGRWTSCFAPPVDTAQPRGIAGAPGEQARALEMSQPGTDRAVVWHDWRNDACRCCNFYLLTHGEFHTASREIYLILLLINIHDKHGHIIVHTPCGDCMVHAKVTKNKM